MKIPAEVISESHALSLFLRRNKDSGFDMTVKIQNNKYYITLMQSVIAIQIQHVEVMKKGFIVR